MVPGTRSEEKVSAGFAKENFIGGAISSDRGLSTPYTGARVASGEKEEGARATVMSLCVYMLAALQSRGREKSKKSINRVEHCLHEA